ncbi:hypothetical protein [Leptolyngbya sp. O-77]|uniref:hypothetical protein n=1 Tax=Leptolyngbya sp. O-77 TaxID=1080068 RepID=UPI000A844555|nr:hypothetical protein [Leptolyngbya sp. O-77]
MVRAIGVRAIGVRAIGVRAIALNSASPCTFGRSLRLRYPVSSIPQPPALP